MGGCKNYGPFLGTLDIRCRTIIGTPKKTIILTTIQISERTTTGRHLVAAASSSVLEVIYCRSDKRGRSGDRRDIRDYMRVLLGVSKEIIVGNLMTHLISSWVGVEED